MLRYMIALAVCVLGGMALAQNKTQQRPQASGASPADSQFEKLAEQWFHEYYFQYFPTNGTYAGFHQYDVKLEPTSAAQIREQIKDARSWLARFEKLDPKPLSEGVAADRELVMNTLRSELLDLESIRKWEKYPDYYSSLGSNAVFTIMSRNFAPQAERLKSVIAREKQIPQSLLNAQQNLKNPPRIYTEIALEQLAGITAFFRESVPAAFSEVKDPQLLAEFKKTNDAVIQALNGYDKFLTTDLLPQSKGEFAIGAETYRKKLLYDEMVETPLDALLEIGYTDLRRNQKWFAETAKQIEPNKTPEQILEEMQQWHPAADKLLQSFRDVLGGLKTFIQEKKIVTIPSEVPPRLEETPPFMRALTFASMDTPGAYEKKATEAFFNVTLPEKGWKPEQVEEHMAGFNYGTIISTAIHEAYPGHYTQFLWVQHAPSMVRKLLGAGSNAEGWAHYTEEMMLNEGYADPGPDAAKEERERFLKLRLGQLQDALLRNARFIVGIEMHTGKMTYDQGIEFFVKEGYQSRTNALRETKRGTSDPTYLIYTLGKLQIKKLRDDYEKKMGDKFALEEFHNTFLKQGYPPVKVIRRTMLGDASPVL